ncbi:protein tyrosine phosphatase, putative [Plasmodium gallinaceum]|uniref:Protein tyrosine phosphatase, putative n=1 Tax=Plasmodium gallinaceum TaxID=5849 RepID=A0A1J1GM07_PLAGA|nr:protein tyrosine phosphatase, putative [Plasmodium gallinaceum]CRG93388.1 protein tyrosine phosphatase, putative [Plasmodium gallinaceum]
MYKVIMKKIKEGENIELIYSLPNENIQDLIVNKENIEINKLIIIKHYNKKEYYIKEIKYEEFNKKSSFLVIFICAENTANSCINVIDKEVTKNENDSNPFIKNKNEIKKMENIKSDIQNFYSYNKYEYKNSRNKVSLPTCSSSSILYFLKRLNKKNSKKIVDKNVYSLKEDIENYFKNAYAKYIYKNKYIYFFIFNSENTHYIDRNLSIKKYLLFKSQIDKNCKITTCYKNNINNNLRSFFHIIKKIYKVKKNSYSNKDVKERKEKSLELANSSKEKKKKFSEPIFTEKFILNNNNKFMWRYGIKKKKDNFPYNKKNTKYYNFNYNRSFITYYNSSSNNKGKYDCRNKTFPYFYISEKNNIKKFFEASKLAYFKDYNFYKYHKYNFIKEKKKNYNDLSNNIKDEKKKIYCKKDEMNEKENLIFKLNFLNRTKNTAVLRSYPTKKKINKINGTFLKKENKNNNNCPVEKFSNLCNLNKNLCKKKSFPFSTHNIYMHKNYFNSSYFSTQRNFSSNLYKKKKNFIYEKKNENLERKNNLKEYVTKMYPKEGLTSYCGKYKRKTNNKKFEKYIYSKKNIRNLNKKYCNSFSKRKDNFFDSNNFEKHPKFQIIKNKDNKKYFCTNEARNITFQSKRKSYFDIYNNENRNFLIKKKNFVYDNYCAKLPNIYHYNLKKKNKYFSLHNLRNFLVERSYSNMKKYNSNKVNLTKSYQIKLNKNKTFNKKDYNSMNNMNNIDKNNKCSISELKAFKTEKSQNCFKDVSSFCSSLEYNSLDINDKKDFKNDMNFSLNLKNIKNKADFEVSLEKLNTLKNKKFKANDTNTRKEKLEFVGNQCDKIFQDRIFISGYEFASNKLNIEEKGITHIINTAGYECENKYENLFFYRTYYLKDDMYDDIFYTLLDSLRFIKNVLKENERNKILIHCSKGISRSVIIIIFFLMSELNLNYFDAFQIVKNSRALSNPNMNYITQLLNIFNIKKTVQNIDRRKENKIIKDKIVNENIINKNNELISNDVRIDKEENMENYKNCNDIICLFRIDLEGKYLTLKKLDNLIYHDSDNDSAVLIDKRFNYIITYNFKDYYLMLFDDTYESIFHSIFNHFILISSYFFGDMNKKYVIRSNFMNIFKNFKIKTKIINSITDFDKYFLNIQSFLKMS